MLTDLSKKISQQKHNQESVFTTSDLKTHRGVEFFRDLHIITHYLTWGFIAGQALIMVR